MSIRTIQIQRVLEDTVRALYGRGVKPTLNEILSEVSHYFTTYPAGLPLSIDKQFIAPTGRSDVETINLIMAHTILNLDVLYEATMDQVAELLTLTSVLRSKLDRLSAKREQVSTLIDDHLLSLYNTDGYYYSSGDNFSDTSKTDLLLTSAFIDTAQRAVVLPTASSLTHQVPGAQIHLTNTRVQVGPQVTAQGLPVQPAILPGAPPKTVISLDVTPQSQDAVFKTVSEFSGAVDGLTNTFWSIETASDSPGEAICRIVLTLGNSDSPVTLSRVDFTPHTISPVQVFVEIGQATTGAGVAYTTFGDLVQTGINKMSFVGGAVSADSLRITMRKTQYDYVDQSSGSTKYKFVFGATEISVVENVYDNQATFVSTSLFIPTDFAQDAVIDAVSLAVDQTVPADTKVDYFVANDPGDEGLSTLDDFDWRPIVPVGESDNNQDTVVRFNGVQQFVTNITDNPHGNDIQRLPFDGSNPDLGKRNPTPVLIPGVDVYRICQFDEQTFLNSLKLQEGINTTRIYTTNGPGGVAGGLGFWATLINSSNPPPQRFGKIDAGNGFFYGGDIGESGKSVYVETYLDMPDERPVYVSEFHKADPNSQTWDVDVYLNGAKVGSLPVGTDRLLIPWSFQKGLNHIALTVDIPVPTNAVPNPYVGTVTLLSQGANLWDLGTVRLAEWSYVSFFDMQYNQSGSPTTFTIIPIGDHQEIITRRKPPTDFRLQYAKSTELGPLGVRVRADLSRTNDNPNVTPRLNNYRLRFSYGQVAS